MAQFKNWVCHKCGQEVLSVDQPTSISWSDGHRCFFQEVKPIGELSVEQNLARIQILALANGKGD